MIRVSVQEADFDSAAELADLEASGGGGIASFIGVVRGEGGLIDMSLEYYQAMTELQIAQIATQAADRWSLLGIRIVHRVGVLKPGDRIVFVGTASRHRTAALESCTFLIDWLKTAAPFWKKERFADGREQWVESRAEDEAKAAGWQN